MREDIIIELEDYNGNTLAEIKIPFFELADMESNSHFRIQAEHMDNAHNINILKLALKQALKELDRWQV